MRGSACVKTAVPTRRQPEVAGRVEILAVRFRREFSTVIRAGSNRKVRCPKNLANTPNDCRNREEESQEDNLHIGYRVAIAQSALEHVGTAHRDPLLRGNPLSPE